MFETQLFTMKYTNRNFKRNTLEIGRKVINNVNCYKIQKIPLARAARTPLYLKCDGCKFNQKLGGRCEMFKY